MTSVQSATNRKACIRLFYRNSAPIGYIYIYIYIKPDTVIYVEQAFNGLTQSLSAGVRFTSTKLEDKKASLRDQHTICAENSNNVA